MANEPLCSFQDSAGQYQVPEVSILPITVISSTELVSLDTAYCHTICCSGTHPELVDKCAVSGPSLCAHVLAGVPHPGSDSGVLPN